MRNIQCRTLAAALALVSAICSAELPRWTNIGPAGGWQYIAPDPATPAHAWVIGQMGDAYQTLDGGLSWVPSETSPCPRLTGAQMRNGIVFASCLYGGVMATRDGRAWTRFWPPNPVNPLTVVPAPGAPEIAIAFGFVDNVRPGGPSGFVVEATQDGGRTWQRNEAPVHVATFDPTAGAGRVVAARYMRLDAGEEIQVYESRSLGVAWRQIAAIPVTSPQVAFSYCGASSIAVDAGGTLYLASPCGLFISRDGGTNWTRAFDLVQDRGQQNIRVDPVRPGHVVIFNESLLMETFDGFATRAFAPGIAAQLTGADITADGTVWVATYHLGVFRYSQGKYTSTAQPVRALGGPVSAVLGANSEVLVTSLGFRSLDGGATWDALRVNGYSGADFNIVTVPGQPLAAYAVVSNNPVNSTDRSSRVFHSSDATRTWTAVTDATRLSSGGDVGFLSPVGPQPGVIYAATIGLTCFDACRPFPASMVRSDDGGKSWGTIDAGLSGSGRQIRTAASIPSLAYVFSDTAVFRSSDSGATWQPIWSVAQRGHVDDLAVDMRDGATLYVRSDDRIFVSEDAGASWRQGAALDVAGAQTLPDRFDAGRAFVVGNDARVFETKDRARSWRQVAMRDRFDADNSVPPRLAASAGARSILANSNVSVYSVEVASPRFIPDTDLWWNPAQQGWGVSIAQHEGGQMFVVWFTYDAQGRPTWRFMPGGTWTDMQTFTGDLYVARGPAYFGVPFAASQVATTKVGTGTLRFADERAGDASFVLDDGNRFDSPFVRMAFGPVARATQFRVADLWWNPLESGWGITLHQQYGTMFAAWFVYDSQGAPSWVIMPDAQPVSPGFYRGDVYSAAGAAAGPFVARNVTTTKVGTATISFDQGRAVLEYTVFGASASRSIERLPF